MHSTNDVALVNQSALVRFRISRLSRRLGQTPRADRRMTRVRD